MDAFNLQPSFMPDTETVTYVDNLKQTTQEGFNMHIKTFTMHNKIFNTHNKSFKKKEKMEREPSQVNSIW